MFEGRRVIVTFTTIPSRANGIYEVLISILGQTVKPDEIVISLPKESKREPSSEDPYQLGLTLINFIERHATIWRPEKDYGPATKLLGLLEREMSLKLGPEEESLIIVLDDDKYYHPKTVENLLNGWKRYPDCVIAQKGSVYVPKEQKEYLVLGHTVVEDLQVNLVLGTGGVLYRASYFEKDIFDYRKTDPSYDPNLFFSVDDIYLSGYLYRRGRKIMVVRFGMTSFQKALIEAYKELPIKRVCTNLDPNASNQVSNPLREINNNNVKANLQACNFFWCNK